MEDQNYNSNYPETPPQNRFPNPPPPQGPDNKTRNILIAIIGVLVAGIASYFMFGAKKEEAAPLQKEVVSKDSAAGAHVIDSAKLGAVTPAKEEYDEEGSYEPFTESYIISNEAYLRSAPSASDETMVRTVKFGDRFYAKEGSASNGYITVYLRKPADVKNIREQEYYVTESVIVSSYQFDEYKKYFSLPPFSTLASKTKKLILDEDYSDGTSYKITQNADRAKYALSYGDFDRDGQLDVAIVLDNNEKQTSRLLVICTNAATKEPYLAFAENYSDKVKINSFKKGAKVLINTEELVPSPNDGLIVKSEDSKMAVLYDTSSQKFKTFYQE